MAAKPKPECPLCGARQRDWRLCTPCTDNLVADLRWVAPENRPQITVSKPTQLGEGYGIQTLPWERQRRSWAGFDVELTVSLTRQGQTGQTSEGRRSTETPLPYDERASRARQALSWINAQALLLDVEAMRNDPGIAEWATWLHQAVRDAQHAIDPSPHTDPTAHVPALPRNAAASRKEILAGLPGNFGVTITHQRFTNWEDRGKITAIDYRIDKLAGYVLLYRVTDVLTLATRKATA
jgi:hypothetical protein